MLLSISTYLDKLTAKTIGTELEADLLPIVGISAMNELDWVKAESTFRSIVNPTEDIYFYRGLCAIQLKDLVEARRIFELAVNNGMSSPALLIEYGEVLTKLSLYKEAIDIYQTIIAASPTTPRPYICLCQTYLSLDLLPDATHYLQQAFDQNGLENPQLWNLKGIILGREDKLDEASIAFATAFSCDELNYDSLFNLAITLVKLNRQSEADLAISRIPASILEHYLGKPQAETIATAELEVSKLQEEPTSKVGAV